MKKSSQEQIKAISMFKKTSSSSPSSRGYNNSDKGERSITTKSNTTIAQYSNSSPSSKQSERSDKGKEFVNK